MDDNPQEHQGQESQESGQSGSQAKVAAGGIGLAIGVFIGEIAFPEGWDGFPSWIVNAIVGVIGSYVGLLINANVQKSDSEERGQDDQQVSTPMGPPRKRSRGFGIASLSFFGVFRASHQRIFRSVYRLDANPLAQIY